MASTLSVSRSAPTLWGLGLVIPVRRSALLAFGAAALVVSLFLPLKTVVGGLTLRPFDPLVVLFVAMFLSAGLLRGPAIRAIPRDAWFILFVLFAVYLTLNGLLLAGVKDAVKVLMQKVEFLFLAVTIAAVGGDERARDTFLRLLLLGLGAVVAGTVLWHVAAGQWVDYKRLGEPKWAFALLASILFPLAYLDRSRSRGRHVLKVMLLASVGLMLLSLERKGWGAFVLAVLAALYLRTHRYAVRRTIGRRAVRAVALYGGLIALTAGLLVTIPLLVASVTPLLEERAPDSVDRVRALGDFVVGLSDISESYKYVEAPNARQRLFLVAFSLQKLRESPLFGIGVDQFQPAIARDAPTLAFATTAHNEYAQYAVEAGGVGLSLYLLLWLLGARRVATAARMMADARHRTWVMVVGAMLGYGLFMNFFVAAGAQNELFLTLPVGLATGLWREQQGT
ncbi:MAG: O-antigen ligase family protein [Candidatus Rokubacteria bacterium]|nr:O-antigen ligase family protein [Candidatus Rokubacteria bacterium]